MTSLTFPALLQRARDHARQMQQKSAFVDPATFGGAPPGGGGGMPMDPAMAGGMPPGGGGMPMDPAMAGGGGMPADPSMGGGNIESVLKPMITAAVQEAMGAAGGAMGGKMPGKGGAIDQKAMMAELYLLMKRVEKYLARLVDAQGMTFSAEELSDAGTNDLLDVEGQVNAAQGGDPAAGGMGGGMPGGDPAAMQPKMGSDGEYDPEYADEGFSANFDFLLSTSRATRFLLDRQRAKG